MAIITIARQVAALGDEVGAALAEKMNYKFIKRTDIEQRIIELGFPKSKMPKYDERKPGFFASIAKNRDEYFNLSQYALLEAAENGNAVIIGRGAFVLFKNIPNVVSVRLVASEKIRQERLQKEFTWTEKQAKQRILESDENRIGFHKNFYNVDIDDPVNFDMVLNTGVMDISSCVDVISNYTKGKITSQNDEEGIGSVKKLLKAQSVVNKLIFEYKIKIEFMHAAIEENTVILYGVSNSNVIVEQAIQFIKHEMPGYDVQSSVSIVHDYKGFQ